MADGTRATIPIFPLANVVLFPKLRVPLYIFEPRYRQMTREALDGARRIGMVTLKPDHIEDTAGDPPVFSIGCEGRIVQSELLADGGYNVVLLGARRFEILSEQLPDGDRLYRTAEVALLSEASTRESPPNHPTENNLAPAAEVRGTIVELLHELLQHEILQHGQAEAQDSGFDAELFEACDDELFVNALAQSLNFSAAEKQSLIECSDVPGRLQQLLALLQFRLAARRSGLPEASALQ